MTDLPTAPRSITRGLHKKPRQIPRVRKTPLEAPFGTGWNRPLVILHVRLLQDVCDFHRM